MPLNYSKEGRYFNIEYDGIKMSMDLNDKLDKTKERT